MAIDEILLEDPNIVRIEPAEQWSILSIDDIDYSKFDPAKHEMVKDKYQQIANFLASPYIVDRFGTDPPGEPDLRHQERTGWKNQLFQEGKHELYEFIQSTALRFSSMSSIINKLAVLRRLYIAQDKNEFIRRVDELIVYFKSTMKEYYGLDIEARITYVRGIKEKVSKVLCYFAKPQ